MVEHELSVRDNTSRVFRRFDGEFRQHFHDKIAERKAQHLRSSQLTLPVPGYMLNEAEYIRTFGY